jgi:hypothetical protein
MGACPPNRSGGRIPVAGRVLPVLLAAVLATGGAGTPPALALAAAVAPPAAIERGVPGVLPDTMVGIRLSPRPDRVGVGLPIAFRVWAIASDGTELADVTDSATVELDGGYCERATCTPLKDGSHVVTAVVYGGELVLFRTAIDFEALEVAELDLAPAEERVQPGGTVPYRARAYARPADDASPRIDLGEVTAVTRFELDGVPCAGPKCTAGTLEGPYRVSGTVDPARRRSVTGFADLVVEPGRPESLTLDPAERTVTVGAAVTYRAVADDGFGNTFDVSKIASFAAGPDVSCAGPVCTPQKPGRYTVTATVGDKPPVTATATLVAELPSPVALRLEPATSRIAVRTVQPYRAFGVGADRADLGEVTARTVFTINKGGTCDRRGCGAGEPGTYTVTGALADDLKVTGSATLTVGSRPAVSVRLEAPADPIVAGATRTYRAIALDDEGRDVGDVTGKVRLSIRDPTLRGQIGRCEGPRCGADKTGTYLVTGRVVGIPNPGQARLTVVPAALARLALAPSQASIVAGAAQAYTVEGFDAHGNDRGELTGRATFSVPPGGSCQEASCTSDQAGTYAVTATVLDKQTGATVTGTAALRVDPAQLAAVRLSPTSARVLADADQPYTAVGFDAFGNPRGEVTARTTFTIGAPGTCAAATCSATLTGAYTVTGTVTGADVAGGKVSAISALRVGPGRPASLVLEPAQATIVTGGTQAYTARGLDAFGNDAGDLTARTAFSISPPGSCRAASCSGPEPRTYTVTGTLADVKVPGAASLTVVPGSPARLVLDPPQRTVAPGAEQAYRAFGYDAAGASLGDVTSRTAFSIEDGRCAGAVCSADRAGDHRVTARLGGSEVAGTARLTVRATEPPDVARLVLSPAIGSVTVGARQPYSARGFDAGGNDRGDVTGRTAFSIEPDGRCAGSACWAERPGLHWVVGVLSGTAVRQAVPLDVTSTVPERLVLEPATASVGAGGLQSYRVRAFGQDGADLGDVSDRTVLSIADGGFCRGLTCGARRPGTYTVAAVPVGGGWVGRATLTVTAAEPATLVLSPASALVEQAATQAYRARGLDAAGNDLGDMTARTVFTIGSGGSCTAAVCTAGQAGDYTVTGRVSGTAVAANAMLRVLPLTSVDDRSGTGGPDWVLLLGGAFLFAAAARSALGRIRRQLGRPPEEPAGQTGPERDGDWVRHNVRTVPYPGPVTSAARRRERRPDFVLHLEAHADPGDAETAEEGSPWT